MVATTTKKDLLLLIQKAFPIVPSKSSLQILSNFKIECGEGRLRLSATDLDHSVVAECDVGGAPTFQIAVNARKVFEIVRELPEGEVRIGAEEGVFTIESEGGFSCKIAGADAHDIPPAPERQTKLEFSMSSAMLSKMVAKSAFAVSKDESRACLCGVLWEVEATSAGMVATDGHRLGRTTTTGSFGVAEKVGVIVSPRTLLHIVKNLEDPTPGGQITVGVGEKYIWIGTPSVTMCSKLIDGPYPDYTRAIPQNNPKKAVLSRQGLIQAVRRVSVLSNQKTNLVKFSFNAGQLDLSVINRDIAGEARETLPVEYEGPEHTIGFNGYYLCEILGLFGTEKVRMEMNTEISACLLFPHPDDEAAESRDLFLIMPLRILDEA